MNNRIVVPFLLLVISFDLLGQASQRKLPTSINHPAINVSAPYMSFDGEGLVFISDNAEDYELTPFYTSREGNTDWKEPATLPRSIYSKLNFLRGYTLGPEGRLMIFSSMKAPGVGGFDLWTTERRGSNWAEPKNIGAPINSRAHEACATTSPDGRTIYFMRCDKMDQKSASGCKIFRATKKSNGQWNEPEPLPDFINNGNSQTPRILADGETLLFASDKLPGNKGGMDLYMTRFRDGSWSEPVPLAFTNTSGDDQYVSVNAQGRYLLRDSKGSRKSELVEYLIPQDLRPKGLMRIDGRITKEEPSIATYLSATDLETGKRVYNGRPNPDGTFTVFLLEGSRYEVAVDPELGNYSYYAKRYDLREEVPQLDRIQVSVKNVSAGAEWALSNVSFEPGSSRLSPDSDNELKRLTRVIKGSPNYKYEIQVMLSGYEEDSVASTPDLTELQTDSIQTTFDEIDTLGQLYKKDTVVVHTIYHNNRTSKQAETIMAYLISAGIPEDSLRYFTNFREEGDPEKRGVEIRVRVLD